MFAEDIPNETGVVSLIPEGIKRTPVGAELVYQLELSSGKALVFCDLLMDGTNSKGLFSLLIGGYFGIPRFVRWIVVNDKAKFKAWFVKLSEIENLQAISAAHFPPITKDCNQQLKDAIKRSYS